MINDNANNLVIDVGNTLTKLAVFKGNELVKEDKVGSVCLQDIQQMVSDYKVKNAIISSVATIPTDCHDYLESNVSLVQFTSTMPMPIKNLYKTPQTLGPDRVAAAVAANMLYPNSNVLVVDSGTALTYDVITANAEYLGGAISLGISMRFKALNTFTSKLPLLNITNNYPIIGSSTNDSILSGVLNGVVNEVDAYIGAIKREYHQLKIVFTGGDAFFFDKKLKNSIFVHPNLVLIGLNRILNYYNE
ncbi:MAG: type III pantothenate kinase [Bacteroidales bacterium]